MWRLGRLWPLYACGFVFGLVALFPGAGGSSTEAIYALPLALGVSVRSLAGVRVPGVVRSMTDIVVVLLKFSPPPYVPQFAIDVLLARKVRSRRAASAGGGKGAGGGEGVSTASFVARYGATIGYSVLAAIFGLRALRPSAAQLILRVGGFAPVHAVILAGLSLGEDPLCRLFSFAPFDALGDAAFAEYVRSFTASHAHFAAARREALGVQASALRHACRWSVFNRPRAATRRALAQLRNLRTTRRIDAATVDGLKLWRRTIRGGRETALRRGAVKTRGPAALNVGDLGGAKARVMNPYLLWDDSGCSVVARRSAMAADRPLPPFPNGTRRRGKRTVWFSDIVAGRISRGGQDGGAALLSSPVHAARVLFEFEELGLYTPGGGDGGGKGGQGLRQASVGGLDGGEGLWHSCEPAVAISANDSRLFATLPHIRRARLCGACGARMREWQGLLSLPNEAAAAGQERSASGMQRLGTPSELGDMAIDKNWMTFGAVDRATPLRGGNKEEAGDGAGPLDLPKRSVQSVDSGFTLVVKTPSNSVYAVPVCATPVAPSPSVSALHAGGVALGPVSGGSAGAVLATSILSLEPSPRLAQLLQLECARGTRRLHGPTAKKPHPHLHAQLLHPLRATA
ncbi:hypothetical protein T492DRAFT_847874 [Pavlovales sp. CCMP2436]|nr:hypothetical protein T492DRAFT_847874 [Pavlovales sp. CCMP2436]